MARERFTIEGTRLMYPNFSGAPDKFNQTPKPNASVVVPPDMVPAKIGRASCRERV